MIYIERVFKRRKMKVKTSKTRIGYSTSCKAGKSMPDFSKSFWFLVSHPHIIVLPNALRFHCLVLLNNLVPSTHGQPQPLLN